MVVGNAVTQLNDRGFKIKVHPPETHAVDGNAKGAMDTEALVLRFETPCGIVCLDVAMKNNLHRTGEPAIVTAS